MATVLRLKRLLSDDPAEAIVVHSKRLKGDDGNKPCEETDLTLKPKYFTLIGSIRDDAYNEQIQELIFKANVTKSSLPTYSEWRENAAKQNVKFKSRFSDGAKRKAHPREVSQEKKLKIVSCSRGIEDLASADVDAAAQSLYKLYDVIEEPVAVESEDHPTCVQKSVISCNGIPLVTKSSNEMAYDLYYARTDDVGDINILDNIVRLDKCSMDEEEQPCATDEVACSSEEGDEDSNDENNWKNEYPDEDDDFEKEYDYYRDYDDDEEEILDMIQSCNMKDDASNGSAYGSEMPADPTDHDGYDYRYSRYKLQMMRELGEISSSDDDSI